MTSKLLFIFVISGMIIITGCVSEPEPTRPEEPVTHQLSEDQLKVTINESHAWLDLMPGDESIRRKHISIPVEIENKAGFDLSSLSSDRADVIKNGEVVGDFKPVFQIRKDCYGDFEIEKMVDEIDLLRGCKLSFNIRAWRNSDNLSDFDGAIDVRFRFVSNNYYSKFFEVKGMAISKAY